MNIDEIQKKLDTENLKLAPFSKRIFALLVDDLIVSGLIFIAMADKISGDSIEQTIEAINSAVFFIIAVKIIYQTIFIALYGATPAKMLFRLRIVNINSLDNPSWQSSFIRALVRIVSEIPFYMGFAWAFSSPIKQTWHDMAAKTLVLDAS